MNQTWGKKLISASGMSIRFWTEWLTNSQEFYTGWILIICSDGTENITFPWLRLLAVRVPRIDWTSGCLFTVRNEAGKVMFFTGVCLSTGWGCLPQCMLGYHTCPPEQTPPGSRHPPRADTPPEADTLQSRHPPRADTPQIWPLLRTVTHPTGMHSCFDFFFTLTAALVGSKDTN